MLLKEIMASLLTELEQKARILDEVQASFRRVILFSKQAVMAIHRHDLTDAESKLNEAETLLRKLETSVAASPDMRGGATRTAYQEYAEAKVLLTSVKEEGFLSPEEIGVPTIPYILGLADAIGEFRRTAVDGLRRGDIGKAENYLQLMEDVYQELLPIQDFYPLISELRRKMDVARHLIELTFSDVSSESHRDSLERALRLLEKRIKVNEGEDRPKQDTERGS